MLDPANHSVADLGCSQLSHPKKISSLTINIIANNLTTKNINNDV